MSKGYETKLVHPYSSNSPQQTKKVGRGGLKDLNMTNKTNKQTINLPSQINR
jgi:hypothetical protein